MTYRHCQFMTSRLPGSLKQTRGSGCLSCQPHSGKAYEGTCRIPRQNGDGRGIASAMFVWIVKAMESAARPHVVCGYHYLVNACKISLEFGMVIYPLHLLKWRSDDIPNFVAVYKVKVVKFAVSRHFLENASQEWLHILNADTSLLQDFIMDTVCCFYHSIHQWPVCC